jgi:beta-glucosidase
MQIGPAVITKTMISRLQGHLAQLKPFAKIKLSSAESKRIDIETTTEHLKFHNSDLVYDWEPGNFILYIGRNSEDGLSGRVSWKK